MNSHLHQRATQVVNLRQSDLHGTTLNRGVFKVVKALLTVPFLNDNFSTTLLTGTKRAVLRPRLNYRPNTGRELVNGIGMKNGIKTITRVATLRPLRLLDRQRLVHERHPAAKPAEGHGRTRFTEINLNLNSRRPHYRGLVRRPRRLNLVRHLDRRLQRLRLTAN